MTTERSAGEKGSESIPTIKTNQENSSSAEMEVAHKDSKINVTGSDAEAMGMSLMDMN